MIKNLFIKIYQICLLIIIYMFHPFIWIPIKIFSITLLLIIYLGVLLAYIPATLNVFSSYLKWKKSVLICKTLKK